MKTATIAKSISRGFTLIEMLVVIVIIAVVVTAVSYSLSGVENTRFSQQSQRLSNWLQHVSDTAVLDGGVYGIRPELNTLTVVAWHANQWLPVINTEVFDLGDSEFTFVQGDAAELEEKDFDEAAEEALAQREEQLQVLDEEEEADLPPPILVFLPTGDMYPLGSIRLRHGDIQPVTMHWSFAGGWSTFVEEL